MLGDGTDIGPGLTGDPGDAHDDQAMGGGRLTP
jgi:hypothetical protein